MTARSGNMARKVSTCGGLAVVPAEVAAEGLGHEVLADRPGHARHT